ncbi:MAG: leucyl/phenylalanyl-tRNA--protein transferase [Xanthomonadaceae bacterium]|nr:leucyl/phenylalanyl-tRNA--protein transferase [Xanthomonadaceae bacterium]
MSELPEGLVAVGGPLTPDRLLVEYRRGVFPWYMPGQPVLWWSPEPRAVFDGCRVRVSRSLRRRLRRGEFRFTLDAAFDDVISGCAQPRAAGEGTWITAEMSAAYRALHRRGYAHSLEVWLDSELVGGVYGVALGRVFFGESMFSRAADASKAALAVLAAYLRRERFTMIDAQLPNAHLARLGASEWSRAAFLARLAVDAEAPDPIGRWMLPARLSDGASAVE